MRADREIDVVGKACPMPLVTLARVLPGLQPGQTVRITGNDPIFEESIVELCHERHLQILETTRQGRVVSIVLKV